MDMVKPILKDCIQGRNGTVLAYGQTGSGKTHTMLGDGESLGVVQFLIRDLFREIKVSLRPPIFSILLSLPTPEISFQPSIQSTPRSSSMLAIISDMQLPPSSLAIIHGSLSSKAPVLWQPLKRIE